MPEQVAPPSRTLIKKLADVMKEVERIPKNGRNDFHKYDYVTEADLAEAVRGKLAEKSVFVFTSVESVARLGDITEVFTLHTFVDGETGETFQVKGYGQGQDKGDKGGYKAMTGAIKYFLMKNFLVATGDDPEQEPKAPAKNAPVPAKAPPAKKAPASTKEQQEEILRLAKDLRMDVQKDICGPAKWLWPLTAPQAEATIKRLTQKRADLAKELDAKVAEEARMADAEREGKKADFAPADE